MNFKYKQLITVFFSALFVLLFAVPTEADIARDGKIIICIDAGHGGKDGGTPVGEKSEKEYNLTIAKYMKSALSKDSRFTVVMTRETDEYLTYLERADIARNANADLLISIHCNQVEESYVSGSSAYVSLIEKYNASDIAEKLLDAISSVSSIKRGRVQTRADSGDSLGIYYWDSTYQWDMPGASSLVTVSDYYSMNTWSSKFGIKSVIVEHGYLSNEEDLAVLNLDHMLEKIAGAEASAIIEYYTNHEHTYVQSVDYPSNCIFDGTLSSRCSICGAKSGTISIPENSDAHFWRRDSSVAASCTERGEEHFICQVSYNLEAKGYDCEVHEKTVTIPALGHNYQTVTNSGGHTVRQCTRCGDEIYTLCTNGAEHRYEITSSSEATCESDGAKTYRCSVCGDQYTDELHTAGHNWQIIDRVNPTSDSDGYDTMKCSVCGAVYNRTISSCNHVFTEESVDSTCDTDGYIKRTCLLCSSTETTVIESKGHDYVTLSSALPSCTETGIVSLKCEICGHEEDEITPATGHVMDKHVFYSVCSVCGYRENSSPKTILSEYPKGVAAVILVISVGLGVFALFEVNKYQQKQKNERRNKFE